MVSLADVEMDSQQACAVKSSQRIKIAAQMSRKWFIFRRIALSRHISVTGGRVWFKMIRRQHQDAKRDINRLDETASFPIIFMRRRRKRLMGVR